ncbi:hypothetical protein OGATHE_006527 [Ogataea polymorpha]|uniref:Uncharacterized protein n=1 Tax=Ogataea polymorpha TaxID=460523 RepID=A0A9P8SXL0_9ASCO|nr:hypothetical protein OGATHE_006527 [Ogataea polymorpha]
MLIRAGIGNIALVGRPFKSATLHGPLGRKIILGLPSSAACSIFVRAKSDKKRPTIPTLSEIRESLYTIPNALTFTRLVAAPVVGYLVVSGQTAWALGLFAYSCVTDFVDGFIARRYNLRSKLGSIIDPMADKALMVICTACLSHIGTVPLYLAALILGRDIMLLLAGIVIRYISLPAPRTFRRSVTISIGFIPAFSASVVGITSNASANSWKHNCSTPENWLDSLSNVRDTSISGAPPPAIKALSFTKQRTTHKASCKDRSVSSRIWLLAPRHTTETVGCVTFFTPVILMILEPEDSTSSTRSAVPKRDSTNESTSAMGLHPRLLLMNSISSLSMSFTTKMLSFARKCKARSLTASRRIDFWINSTLHLAFLIFLQILNNDVLAARINASLSSNEILCDMSSRISTLRPAALVNASEMIVGWIPLFRSFSAAPSKAPVITTTEVVPSPASTSCAPDKSTSILAAGCRTAICLRIVWPSLEMITSPRPVLIILSMPFGPKDVLMASATALAAKMFALRTSCGFSLFLNVAFDGRTLDMSKTN